MTLPRGCGAFLHLGKYGYLFPSPNYESDMAGCRECLLSQGEKHHDDTKWCPQIRDRFGQRLPAWMKDFGYVLATKMLVQNRHKVRFMYREECFKAGDSGWRFFCGDEDDDYVNNPNNIAIYAISTIVEIDRSIVPYLNSVPGAVFEREDENADFVVSKGFDGRGAKI